MAFGLINGPSKCAPRTFAPSVPSSFSFLMTFMALLISSVDTVIVVGKKDVVPCSTITFAIVLRASTVPSIVSYPPAPCICTSINPGERYKPLASKTSPLKSSVFIFSILPSLINIDPSSILS